MSAPFDPRSLRGSHEVEVWEPGRRIRLARRWHWGAVAGLVVVLGFAGLLGFAAVATARSAGASLLATALVGLGLGAPIVLAVVLAFRPHWTELDWKRERWRFERGGASTDVEVANVRGIRVVGRRVDPSHTVTKKSGRRVTRRLAPAYYCAVTLVHAKGTKERSEELFTTDFADELDSRWPLAVPFAEELARVIGQPCLVGGGDDPA